VTGTKRIAVTGAAGNVGSLVVEHLRLRGNAITSIDVVETSAVAVDDRTVVADLTSYAETLSALEGVEVVVHLAGINAPIVGPPWKVHNNNVTASYNVLCAAAELGIRRVVQSSSVNAIGLAWSRTPQFDYFPIDTFHPSRTEDPYSLSKLFQELQADSVTRRNDALSVVSLRLHAVLPNARAARELQARLGDVWAVNGLFGYCTYDSVLSAVELACSAWIERHEVLLVVEPDTFMSEPSALLAAQYFPTVPLRCEITGRRGFFDTSRTESILGWTPSTAAGGQTPREGELSL
jgi:nucleoside-diphosphate-sugar epimerase